MLIGIDWLSAGWTLETNSPYAGQQSVYGPPGPTLPYGTRLSTTLGGTLDLSGAVNPQLTYWLKGSLGSRSWFYVQGSQNNMTGSQKSGK